MKLAGIEAIIALVKNGTVMINDVPIATIYEIAQYYKSEVSIRNEWVYTTIKTSLVTLSLTNAPI